MRDQNYQDGFAMLEVLISILVVSFGFMSLLSMQLNMLSTVSISSKHFLASSLAHDMGERIRSNKPQFLGYNGFDTSTFSKDCENEVDLSVEVEEGDQPVQYICSMAEEDFFQWKNNISESSQAFLDGVGSVTAVGSIATITINWSEKKSNRISEDVSYSLQVSTE